MTIVVVGAEATLTFNFADEAGALYDPDSGSIILRAPSQALGEGTEYDVLASGVVERISTGVYALMFDASEGGRWRWRAEAMQGDRLDVGEGSFTVQFSRVISELAS